MNKADEHTEKLKRYNSRWFLVLFWTFMVAAAGFIGLGMKMASLDRSGSTLICSGVAFGFILLAMKMMIIHLNDTEDR